MNQKNLVVIPKMTGTEANVTVTIREATFQEQADGARHYPDPNFGVWLIEQLHDREKIFATRKGLFKKSYWCPTCGTELGIDERKVIESTYKLEFMDFPPFFIDIAMPSVPCLQCKKVNGIDPDGAVTSNLGEAIVHAFNSRNVRP